MKYLQINKIAQQIEEEHRLRGVTSNATTILALLDEWGMLKKKKRLKFYIGYDEEKFNDAFYGILLREKTP